MAVSGYIDCVVGARAAILTQTETMMRAEAATDAAAVTAAVVVMPMQTETMTRAEAATDAAAVTAAVVVMPMQTTLVALQSREVWLH